MHVLVGVRLGMHSSPKADEQDLPEQAAFDAHWGHRAWSQLDNQNGRSSK
ncbi:hypothetical protein KR52_08830 [Synechococcus sp. KORDI-52]|nr:hypothetical protein KR52_08830 [Synechococcus sp. KORDI-52]